MNMPRPRMPSVRCPACGGNAYARNMGLSALTFRELYYHCRDELACGHVFVVAMEARRTIRSSMVEQPLASLPKTTWRAETATPANDDSPQPQQLRT